jgi:hypothetical protein
MRSLASIPTSDTPFPPGRGDAVLNARKRSPDPFPATLAAGQAVELVREERRVGGHEDDDRALVLGVDEVVAELLADGEPGDPELMPEAEVGLHEDAQGVPALAGSQPA